MKIEKEARLVILASLFATVILVGGSLGGVCEDLTALPSVGALTIGPIRFIEIYFLAGDNMERRSPRVEEEFIVKAHIRNEGSTIIYYLPTLRDTSLSAIFDPSYVRVESGRPRCLAASMPTPLKPSEETIVSAPESGTGYVAIRAGSTTATVVLNYDTDSSMDQSTQAEARSTVPLTIQDKLGGFALAIGFLVYRKGVRTRWDTRETPEILGQSFSLFWYSEKSPVLGTLY